MALSPLVTVEDLEGWLGSLIEEGDRARAGMYLVAVSSLVRSEVGKTWEGLDVPEQVRAVTLTVAARMWLNPEAASSYSITTGAMGKSVTFANPRSVGLYLDAADRAALGRYAPNARGLWTMGTTRNDAAADTIYVPIEGTDALFPWYSSADLL